jgi:hypothetical protein
MPPTVRYRIKMGHDSAAKIESDSERTRILVFGNDTKIFDPLLPRLAQKGFEVRFARNLVMAVGQIATYKPHAVLLSWNLARYNIKDVYKDLSERLQAVVVVYSEIPNPTALVNLTSSGISQTLLPPFNAESIALRIHGLRKKNAADSRAKSDRLGCRLVPASSVTEQLNWHRLHANAKRGPEPEGPHLWQGLTHGNERSYLFEGMAAPVFSLTDKSWNTGSEKPVFVEATPEGKSFVNALGVPMRATETANPLAEKTGPQAEAAAPDPVTANMHMVERCVRSALKSQDLQVADPLMAFPAVTNVSAVIFHGQKFQGYLLGSTSIDCFDPDWLLKISKNIAQQLNRFEEQVRIDDEPMLLVFAPPVWQKIVSELATFTLKTKRVGHDAGLTYVAGAALPKLGEQTDKNYVAVPVESLVAGYAIDFDLYLNLPSNKKFVLYRKKHSILSDELIANFKAFECRNIYVLKEELDLVRAYNSKTDIAERSGSTIK